VGTAELTVYDWDGYAARWTAMHGGFDPRRSSPLTRAWMRLAYGCARPLARISVRASALTTFSLLCCVGVPVPLFLGPVWALAAAGLVGLATFAETLGSAVAVVTGRITPLGTVYHAVAARLGEACWLAALWLAGVPAWLATGCCAVAWLHEYARTESTLSGMNPARMVTMAEHQMRFAASVVGLALSGLASLLSPELAVGAATMAATVWLLLGIGGLIQLADSVQHSLR
jgi:CDP-diacylglycerol--glycerol-3-phosphate 3-phosphatidyltransferase